MEPIILKQAFPANLRERIVNDCDLMMKRNQIEFDPTCDRMFSSSNPRLSAYSEYLLPLVREIFNEPDLLPSYQFWARYRSATSRLEPHKDKNACTYTVDYCVRQVRPWDIIVEGQPYTLRENQALVFMGEEQEHWRPPFSPGNSVEMIFFHFVRPDHWYFTD